MFWASQVLSHGLVRYPVIALPAEKVWMSLNLNRQCAVRSNHCVVQYGTVFLAVLGALPCAKVLVTEG